MFVFLCKNDIYQFAHKNWSTHLRVRHWRPNRLNVGVDELRGGVGEKREAPFFENVGRRANEQRSIFLAAFHSQRPIGVRRSDFCADEQHVAHRMFVGAVALKYTAACSRAMAGGRASEAAALHTANH